MKKELTREQKKELEVLASMPDEEIDYSDIPQANWKGSVVGKFYRPIKQTVTIRLDADVVDWLRHGGRGYQTRINNMLRSVMDTQRKQKAA